jgi:glycosyltransferase involved in cell wall biosynthesis
VAEGKRLLILTRDRTNASFRQRLEPYLELLAAHGITTEVVVLSPNVWTRRAQMRRAHEFAGVLLHRKTLTAWDAWALDGASHRLFYDFDDAVMYQARAADQPEPMRLRRFQRVMTRAHLVLAGCPTLAEHAQREGARHVAVLPTGLDSRRFPIKTHHESKGRLRLVWIGSHSTLKQLAALSPVLEALGKVIPKTELRVIADAPLEVKGLKVENLPWSYETEGPLLAECDIGIAPLPDTPFTRGKCGFKVLEYMAAGLPVVASPVGVHTDYVQPNINGFWATTPDEWIKTIERLAGDAALRKRLGRMGRERACAKFDFAALGPKFCQLVHEALERPVA